MNSSTTIKDMYLRNFQNIIRCSSLYTSRTLIQVSYTTRYFLNDDNSISFSTFNL